MIKLFFLQDKRCSSHIPNGVLGRNCTGNVGSYCQVSCYHGYQLHNDVLGIYCNKDRRWSVIETKICQQVEGKYYYIQTIINIQWTLMYHNIGFLCSYLCLNSYVSKLVLYQLSAKATYRLNWGFGFITRDNPRSSVSNKEN